MSCKVAIGISYKFIIEVTAANNTATKNTIVTIPPPGMFLNRLGKCINIRPGPPASSCEPVVAIAGIITNEAMIAANESKNAIVTAELGISSLSSRYEPYITVPLPPNDREKNA